jgi:two-component system nitrogen regulation response regulator GlnG/two-component system response regulator HydG
MDALKHDFAARLTVRTQVPGLDERVEDIPLLVRHILLRLAQEMPDVHARFFEVKDGRIEPRIEPALVEALVMHRYTHHLRELERLVWLAVSSSKDQYLARTKEVEAELRLPSTGEAGEAEIRAALEASSGNVTRAARHLGLKNRFALYRLMKQYGIAGAESEEEEKG